MTGRSYVRVAFNFPWLPVLFFLFLGLKLAGHITWSWWWVTAPLWGYGVLAVLAYLMVSAVLAYENRVGR